MYQSLIWLSGDKGVLGDEPGGLAPPLDAEDSQGLADALVDGVRRNVELGGDFLGAHVAVDEPQAIELAWSEAADALDHQVLRVRAVGNTRRIVRSVRIIHCNIHPAKHCGTPTRVHRDCLWHLLSFIQFSADLAPFPS
jgi:hypothetical protein